MRYLITEVLVISQKFEVFIFNKSTSSHFKKIKDALQQQICKPGCECSHNILIGSKLAFIPHKKAYKNTFTPKLPSNIPPHN